MHIYIYMYIYICIKNIRVYIFIHIYIYICKHTYMHLYLDSRHCVSMLHLICAGYLQGNVRVNECVYIYLYSFIYVYMYICKHTYIHLYLDSRHCIDAPFTMCGIFIGTYTLK